MSKRKWLFCGSSAYRLAFKLGRKTWCRKSAVCLGWDLCHYTIAHRGGFMGQEESRMEAFRLAIFGLTFTFDYLLCMPVFVGHRSVAYCAQHCHHFMSRQLHSFTNSLDWDKKKQHDERPKTTITETAATFHAILSLSRCCARPKFPTPRQERKEETIFKKIRTTKQLRRRKDDHKSQLEFQFGLRRGTESIVSSHHLQIFYFVVFAKFFLPTILTFLRFYLCTPRVSVNRKVNAINGGRRKI